MLVSVSIKRGFFSQGLRSAITIDFKTEGKRPAILEIMSVFSSWKLNSPFANWENYEKWEQVFAQKGICFYCAALNETEHFYFMTEHVWGVHATLL